MLVVIVINLTWTMDALVSNLDPDPNLDPNLDPNPDIDPSNECTGIQESNEVTSIPFTPS
jgi:hypothetical protein